MIRILAIAIMFLSAQAVNAQPFDYAMNPAALQQALQACPEKQPKQVSCAELKAIAMRLNTLADVLSSNPQGFGIKILALQQTIATQTEALQDQPERSSLRSALLENEQRLKQYLAIVKWLESPRG